MLSNVVIGWFDMVNDDNDCLLVKVYFSLLHSTLCICSDSLTMGCIEATEPENKRILLDQSSSNIFTH